MLSDDQIDEIRMKVLWECGSDHLAFARAIEREARQQALEEAAQVCDSVDNYANPMTARDCSDAIRALKEQP